MENRQSIVESEYHAFGPWILEINEKYPMPSLFLPYYREDMNSLMLIKVPRNLDRRDAKPGMDLYDYVIGMYDTYGYILKRQGKEIEETKFYYDQVESIENYSDLLLGTLTIHINGSKLMINYNAVSEEIIARLVKIIRDRYTKTSYPNLQCKNISKQDITETRYENLVIKMDSLGDVLEIKAFQPVKKIEKNGVHAWQILLRLLNPKLLLSTLHLLSDKELLIISRGKPIKYRRESVLSCCFTYMPIERIDSIKLDKWEEYSNLQIVHINMKDESFMFYFDENNKKIEDFYKELSNII